jgi:hypothetical protein
MKSTASRLAALALAGLAVTASAQAQNVRVASENAEQARAAMDASVRAAARGERVGMITGRANPEAQRLPNGAIVQELDASTMSYSVARVNAQGQLEYVCVSGLEAAEKAMKSPGFAKRMSLNAKEQTHVVK